MNIPSSSFKARRRVGILAALVMVLTLFAPLSLNGSAAVAADNPKIHVKFDTLSKATLDGSLVPGQASKNDVVSLRFAWDATQANPQPGESFSIEFPAAFESREPGVSVDLNFAGKKVGECSIEKKKIQCTFNDGITGQKEIKGTASALLIAVADTGTDTSANFVVNGEKIQKVGLPDGKPIGPGRPPKYNPTKLGKSTTPMGKNHKIINWEVAFDSTAVQEATGVPADGVTRQTIVFEDFLSGGQVFTGADNNYRNFTLSLGDSKTALRPAPRPMLTRGDGTDPVTQFGDFDLVVEKVSPTMALVKVTGPFQPDTNYHMVYQSEFTSANKTVVPGVNYSNKVKVQGTSLERSASRAYYESFTATIEMTQGYGSFKATKSLSGTGVDNLSADQKYTLEVQYTLPAGKQDSDYVGWAKKPAQNPFTIEVSSGMTTQPDYVFPAGTVLTIREPNMPVVDGVQWEQPTFIVKQGDRPIGNGTDSVSVTVVDQNSLGVTVNNTANKVPVYSKFSVTKRVNGIDKVQLAGQKFVFDYRCAGGATGELQVGADETAQSNDVLVDDVCVITERKPNDPAGFHTTIEKPKTVLVKNAQVVDVEFTNTYKAMAKFAITKNVTGLTAGLEVPADQKFTFSYVCSAEEGKAIDPFVGELEVAANGSVDGPEVPVGHFCRISEKQTAEKPIWTPENWEVTLPEAKTITIAQDVAANVATMENAYKPLEAKFFIEKTVSGLPQGVDVPTDQKFTFTYTCGTQTGELQVGAGDSVAGPKIPVGTVCQIAEKDGAWTPQHWALTKPADQELTIAKDASANLVTFENVYSQQKGRFSVTKNLEGIDAVKLPNGQQFTFNYTCTSGANGSLTVAPGATVSSSDLNAGDSCTITEVEPTEKPVGFAWTKPADQTVVIANGTVEATFVNTYTQQYSKFSVTKSLEGLETSDLPANHKFAFTYNCGEEQGELEVPAGATVESKDIKVGSTCTITENDPTGHPNHFNVTKPGEQQVAIELGKVNNVIFKNVYERPSVKFTVSKTVSGLPNGIVPAGQTFAFNYTCGNLTGQLQVPAGGSIDGPAVPAGTVCNIEEAPGAWAPAGWDLTIPPAKTLNITKDATVNTIAFDNAYVRQMAKFSVSKTVTGIDAAQLPAGTEFVFNYTCGTTKGELKVAAGATVAGPELPVGTECEITEAQSAGLPGWDLTVPPAQTITIAKDAAANVASFENAYVRQMAKFSVSKTVTGIDAAQLPAGTEFVFNYTCGTTKGELKVAAGATVAGPELPVGTECEITEAQSAGLPGWDLTVPPAQTITIAKDAATNVASFENAYMQKKGSFSVTKEVKGIDPTLVANQDFTFEYTCGDQDKQTLTVRNGQTVAAPELAWGTECTISEVKESTVVAGATLKELPKTQTITIGDEPKIELTFVNEYEIHKTPPAPETKQPENKLPKALPKTGATVAGISVVALVLLGLGLVLRRTRKNNQD